MYSQTTKRVSWGNHETEKFQGEKGLRQGCLLFGGLFGQLLAQASSTMDNEYEGVEIGVIKITNLLFADDRVLTAMSNQAMTNTLG